MKKKRGSDDVMYAMIETLLYNPEISRTNLMYKANLSHTQMLRYLVGMIKEGFIREVTDVRNKYFCVSKSGYFVLPKGVEFYVGRRIEQAIKERFDDDTLIPNNAR